MTWIQPTPPTPATIQRVTITLSDRLATDDEPASQTANYQLVILDQNGRRYRDDQDAGNLVPHITPTEQEQLMAFMTSLRTRATAAIIGE